MKVAAFFSHFAPDFINHTFRLKGLEVSDPSIQVDYFQVESKKWRNIKKDQYERWIALGSVEVTDFEFNEWINENSIFLEKLNLEFVQNIPSQITHHESDVWVWSLGTSSSFEFNRKLFALSFKEQPSLFLCQDAGGLEQGPLPGSSTFFSPVNPQLHFEAIQRAKCVISDTWETCLLAQAIGKPTLKLKRNAKEPASGPKNYKVTEVECADKTPLQVFEECKRKLLRSNVQSQSLSENNYLSLRGDINLCSVSDFSYLPFFLGFVENIKQVSKVPVSVSLLALDSESKRYTEEKYGSAVRVYELSQIWAPEELKQIKCRPMGIQAYSSKARLLKAVFNHHSVPTVYCDSDVFFFSCPSHLLTTFGSGHTVLFPHWNDFFPEGRSDGLFNAGMIGIRSGSEGFIDWWASQCLKNCDLNPEKGVVGDQAYLDFAPIFFEGIQIYRGKDHNLARWNIETLGLNFSPQLKINNSDQVEAKTFHAAFIDSKGFFEFKFCWDQLMTVFLGFPVKKSPVLLRNILVQQQKYWLSLSRGVKLRDKVASVFKQVSGLERAIQESSVWFSVSLSRVLSWAVFVRKKLLFSK